jgi:RHS repeat-associated protein
MGLFGDLWDDAKRGVGDVINDGAHVLGDGLNLVGLHGAAQAVETEGDKIGYSLGGCVGELQLGQTNDPAELVHGDASAIRGAAARLRSFSSAFGETASGLRGIDTGQWEGAAADAFRAKFSPEPGKWSEASSATGKAAGALESYAGTVQSAQSEAQRAIDLWNQGQEATKQAVTAYNQQVAAYNSAAHAYNAVLASGHNPGTPPREPEPFSDPGEVLRTEAQQVLTSARQDRNAAAASAAATVGAAASMAPAEPSFWSQVGDDLSDTFAAGQVADVSLTSGVLEGVADIGKFARTLNPDDPWNEAHPAEYAAGLSGTLAGLSDAAMNPADLVKGMVGTGWGSDPFQAFGKLVPNLALTALTDGGGAAADAGDAGADIAENTAENTGANAAENAVSRDRDAIDTVGDPVDVATGDVLLTQTDVSLPGLLPLVLKRVHRSSQRGGRWFGESWVSSLDQRLLVIGDRIAAVFADGQVLLWPRGDGSGDGSSVGDGSEVGDGVLPKAGPAWPLRRLPDGAFTVTDPQRGWTWRFAARPGFWRYADGQGELPLVSVTDRAGHRVAFEYDESGRPAFVTHSGGYRVSVTVSSGRVAGLALGGVPLVGYEYDSSGQLVGVVNSSGQPLRLSYDPAGRLTGWIDRNGGSYQYTYDDLGRCVRGESSSGALSATYSYGKGVTRWTNAAGAVTAYSIDRAARVDAITDPLGNVTRFEHDPRNRVTARTDPLGRGTRFLYDSSGNLVTVTRADGSVARAVYDARCQAVELVEPGGAVWRQSFDSAGNRTAVAAPDGTVTRYSYDAGGHLTAVAGPDGGTTLMRCDPAGLPVSVTGPDGGMTRYERDQFGRVRRIIDPAGAVTMFGWTVEGRPVSRTLPDGSVESWTWDAEGNLGRHVSPAGAVTGYEYGPFDKMVLAERPGGTGAAFGYDPELRLASVTYGGLTWRYVYDPAGRLVSETDYNGAVTRYSYDDAGQLVRRVNAVGQEVLFGYDVLGNVVEELSGDAVTNFGYDEAGRLMLARNASAEVVFIRDALGRVTAESCDGRTVSTSYDAAGRVVSRVTPSGAATTWSYDTAGLPVAMQVGRQELRFGYGADGREILRELPGGLALTQDWDQLGRLSGQVLEGPALEGLALEGLALEGPTADGRALQRRSYAYNPDGFVTGISDLLTGSRAFGLDASGRVTTVTGAEWSERYSYDPAGNVASAAWPGLPSAQSSVAGSGPGSASWLEDGPQGPREVAGTLISRAGNVRYRHDAAGRIVSRTRTRISRKAETWRYEWDAENRLVAVTVPDGTVWKYRYDPLGRRVAKQHVSASGELLGETRFTWDGVVLAEQAETVVWPDGEVDGPSLEQVTTWDYQPGTFTPLAQASRISLRDAPQEVIDERFYSIITDLTGTPTELVAPDGSLAGYQQRTLWGNTLWHPSGESTPLRFPGQYADPETGLHYNNQRYYDPVSGAYLTPDPLGLSPAPNPHTYVSNPMVLIDPLGLAADDSYSAGAANPGSVERVGDFASNRLSFEHYAKHVQGVDLRVPGNPRYVGSDLPEFNNFSDYKYAARQFMGGGTPEGAIEGIRPGGDLVRMDPKSGYFGIRSSTGAIRTFFRPSGEPSDWLQYFYDQFEP